MGALLSMCTVGQLACCCSSAACSLFCSACPSCRNSTSTRIMYALMLLLTTLTAWIMMLHDIEEKLHDWVPFCKNGSQYYEYCQNAVGYLAVYRLLFAQTMFFVIFSVLMLNVKSSRDARAGLQNGFWAIKYLILLVISIASFFIPEANSFGIIWMYIGMIGGFIFILIQLILIIDFAHTWAEHWVDQYEETGSKVYYFGLLAVTLANYIFAIAGVVLFFVYYTAPNDCGLQKFFISVNLIISVAINIISILPKVQEAQPRSGLLQASLISLYTMYLTWSALNNSSNTACKPEFLGNSDNTKSFDGQALVGLGVWFACVLYSSIRTSTNTQVAKITMSEKILMKDQGSGKSHTARCIYFLFFSPVTCLLLHALRAFFLLLAYFSVPFRLILYYICYSPCLLHFLLLLHCLQMVTVIVAMVMMKGAQME